MTENEELSERELEILRLVATGASNKEIAVKLYISTNTVKVHLRNIFYKLNVASRTEAAMYAVNSGIVDSRLSSESAVAPPPSVDEITESLPEPLIKSTRNMRLLIFGILISMIAVTIALFLTRQPRMNIFNPALSQEIPDNWQALKEMPTPRSGFGLAIYQDRILAIAGESAEGITNVLESYNPQTDSWEKAATKPTAVTDVQAIVVGGKVYVPGGERPDEVIVDYLEIYDPIEDSWGTGSKLPEPRSAYALASFEGKLYLFGGWDGEKFTKTVYEYNPGSDSWRKLPDMLQARGYSGAAVSGRQIIIFGGFDGVTALANGEVFVPDRIDSQQNKVWAGTLSMPSDRYAMGVTSVADYIYLVGGASESGDPIGTLVYLPLVNEWQQLSDIPLNIGTKLGAVNLGVNIFAVGGLVDNKPTANNWKYQIIYTVSAPIIRK